MTDYSGERDFQHGEVPAIGILFANLGTPDEPTPSALRRYLAEFLWDPRVVEAPRWQWWLILNGIILNTRPKNSAELYEKVWTPEGSPLLLISNRQAAAIQAGLRERLGNEIHVAVGMRYGNPSIESGLEELRAKACRKILVLPAYPQYSAVTTGSTFDAVADTLKTWRWVPGLRLLQNYHDHPGYISALAGSVRRAWAEHGKPKKLLMSFHGMPVRYLHNGDPYHCECHKTARLVAEELGLEDGEWMTSFQSLFGKEEWLRPYTDELLEEWGKEKLESVHVMCPGFSADCLETIDEIGRENREVFHEAGGGDYLFIPCLNDDSEHVDALCEIAQRELEGWTVPKSQWNSEEVLAAAHASRAQAEAHPHNCPVKDH